jgi:hypothetical protein
LIPNLHKVAWLRVATRHDDIDFRSLCLASHVFRRKYLVGRGKPKSRYSVLDKLKRAIGIEVRRIACSGENVQPFEVVGRRAWQVNLVLSLSVNSARETLIYWAQRSSTA